MALALFPSEPQAPRGLSFECILGQSGPKLALSVHKVSAIGLKPLSDGRKTAHRLPLQWNW